MKERVSEWNGRPGCGGTKQDLTFNRKKLEQARATTTIEIENNLTTHKARAASYQAREAPTINSGQPRLPYDMLNLQVTQHQRSRGIICVRQTPEFSRRIQPKDTKCERGGPGNKLAFSIPRSFHW